jgi:hypothetical protein
MMRTKKTSLLMASVLAFCAYAAPTNADVAVIVHPSFPGGSLSKADFARLYLGRGNTFPSGKQAKPIELASGPVRDEMLTKLLEKTDAQFVHIWSRLVFSGNAKSLDKVADDNAMLARVASDPSAIGYVDSKSVTSSVKVLTVE